MAHVMFLKVRYCKLPLPQPSPTCWCRNSLSFCPCFHLVGTSAEPGVLEHFIILLFIDVATIKVKT